LNAWLRARYSIYARFYDLGPGYHAERRRAIQLLALRPGERVLVPGVGTGADLALLPPGLEVLGIDLTPAMLARARVYAGNGVELRVMDAERLELPDAGFDAVLLHQVLEVVGDPATCLAEAARVLRPGGRLTVFDKFLPDASPRIVWRSAVARLVDLVFTAVKLRFLDVLARSRAPLDVEVEEPCEGPFRILLLRRRRGDAPAGSGMLEFGDDSRPSQSAAP
jgi:phosphatidylethanolamine/phosphatidyl-N-methylethanolamine N-methyltransferase